MLAGISPAYYTRIEQGDGGRVSDEVASALARALRLTQPEIDHLFRLVNPQRQVHADLRPRPTIRPSLTGLLEAIGEVPALLVGRRSDILAWNDIGSAVFGDLAHLPFEELNWARLLFLHDAHRKLFTDWSQKASDVVGQLRVDAGQHPDDRELDALVDELTAKSPTFAHLWAQQDIAERCHGLQRLDHPAVGRLELYLESFRLAGEEDLSLVTYHATPGSESHDRLALLGGWTASAGDIDHRRLGDVPARAV